MRIRFIRLRRRPRTKVLGGRRRIKSNNSIASARFRQKLSADEFLRSQRRKRFGEAESIKGTTDFSPWGFIIALLVISTGLGFSNDSLVWDRKGQGIYESDVQTVLIDPRDDHHLYAGTSKGLYESRDGGKSYRMILRVSGEEKGINDIYISHDHPGNVYAATDAGLYESPDAGKTWGRTYSSSDAGLRQCFSVIRSGEAVYLGTRKGLFYKTRQETRWVQIRDGLDDKPVYRIVGDDEFLYFATGQMVFALDQQTREPWRIFSLGIGSESEADEASDETLTNERERSVRFVEVSGLHEPRIFVATTQGIYSSLDYGEDWEPVPTGNLALGDLTSLLVLGNGTMGREDCPPSSPECLGLMAGTRKGAFIFDDGKWTSVYKGMETNAINDLTKDARGTVYAATDKGIFSLSVKENPRPLNTANVGRTATTTDFQGVSEIQREFDHEPGIHEVHRMAIEYAEVSHEKIKDWRRQARQRAWLPSLDIGVDGDRDWSSSDSIWGSYTNGGQHYVGPDDKTRGEDIGWDASLSWDLADLVWSSDQTTIDSRSKLMVELREDILNEVTRLYFERRRNQIELVLDEGADWRIRMDKEMRVAELTALIDALTGGGFSEGLATRKLEK